MLQKELRGCFS